MATPATPTVPKPWYKKPRVLTNLFGKVVSGAITLDLVFNNGAAGGAIISLASPVAGSVYSFLGEQATGGVSMLIDVGGRLAEGIHESRQGPRP